MLTSSTDLEQYDLYRIIKLTTGETLMATLVDENDTFITFEYPIAAEYVKIATQSGIRYELSTTTYCPFTDDRTFTVPVDQIQHINDMNKDMVRSYLNMVFGVQQEVHVVPEGSTIH